MRFILIIALLSILSLASYAQDKLFVAPFTIFNNDTFFIAEVPEVQVLAFKDKKERTKYFILKRRVKKVYPYALAAKKK